MANETQITVVGNVVADVDLKFTPAGVAAATFTVAVNKRVKGDDGWRDGPASFFRVTAWRQLAENVADRVRKGQRVVVTGRLEVRSYETKDGARGTSVEIDADDVGLSLLFAGERKASAAAVDPWAQQSNEAPF